MSQPSMAQDARGRRRQRTRQEILQAAWRLAHREGVANLSLRELAGEVGMRAPSLYTYFDSKAAIFDAMFTEGWQALDELYDDLDLSPEPIRVLKTVVVRFLEFCQASIPRYQLMFTRAVADWEPSPDAYAASVASYDRMAEKLRAFGIEGQPALDLWTAVTAGLAAQQIANDPTGDRWVRLSGDAVDMYLAHLRGKR